ncbi:sensor histidine kinase [Kribbella sp. NPDC051586]|uniref:sensor histidine kinase n=1 Tax=Kribbella sp. NPDC051586 TaxID=3364118 RepID=UPI0037910C32
MRTTRLLRPAPADIALAVAFAVVAEVELRVSSQNILAGHVPVAVDSLLVLVPLVPLAWRRAAPIEACVAVAAGLTLVGAAFGGTLCFFGGLFPFLVTVYSASAWARAPWDRAALAVPVLLMAPMHWYIPDFRLTYDAGLGLVLSGMAWTAGQGARRWRRQSQQLAAALAVANAGRDAQAALAVAEERATIARELHDIIAHSMSVIVMQAGIARLDVRDAPDKADAALERIEGLGKSALQEMRRLLGIWRDHQDLEPQPGLDRLPSLLRDFAAAGLSIDHRIEGDPRRLSTAQDVSAYRVIGEALTNAARHGGPGKVRLDLDWRTDELSITVSNPLAATPPTSTSDGHGLVGMRERAAVFGGRCSTAVDSGRHVTTVEFPYDAEPA